MANKVHFIFDDSDRDDLLTDAAPEAPLGSEIDIDGQPYRVKSSTVAYSADTSDAVTTVHLVRPDNPATQ